MIYEITHRTEYEYAEPVSQSYNEARLCPRSFSHQICQKSEISVSPRAQDYSERRDIFGNKVSFFTLQEPHQKMMVTMSSLVTVETLDAPVSGDHLAPWEEAVAILAKPTTAKLIDAKGFTFASPQLPQIPEVHEYALPSFWPGRILMDAVVDLMGRIYRDFAYVSGSTTISTPLTQVLAKRQGVCQDFAHLAIACVRSMGLAARYVSGYLETQPPVGKPKLVGVDASHAWFSVYVPHEGWVDFDPTNNLIPNDRHITCAWGRDFADVTPLKGVIYGGGSHQLKVSVDVRNLTPQRNLT
ncbi:MAG: transglutaminase family protein [bacterium]|nr:transglutaminase family protein [bacterium]